MAQIMNLRQLAPHIQEQILFLPRVQQGRDPIYLHHLQPIATILDWRKQRLAETIFRHPERPGVNQDLHPCSACEP